MLGALSLTSLEATNCFINMNINERKKILCFFPNLNCFFEIINEEIKFNSQYNTRELEKKAP